MKSTTRKHIWPVSLVMTLAVVGMLAAFVALAVVPQGTEAQGTPPPPPPPAPADPATTPEPSGPAGVPPPPAPPGSAVDGIDNSSTSGGAGVKLVLTISNPGELVSGSAIELYLEDDFQVPDNIDSSDVYLIGSGDIGRVYVTDPIEIDDDDHYGGDDDWSILVLVPDQNPDNDDGFDAWSSDDAAGLQVVFTKGAGIKNPTEAGTHSVGYSVLAPGDDSNDGPMVEIGTVATVAKISLSADDGGRGKEVTVTGSGFNNGTGAGVYVLVSATEPSCEMVVGNGDKLGETEVGSDDKFTITFTVHQDEFDAGEVNWLCAVDSEAGNARMADSVKGFELTATVSVDPASGSYGDEITLKARDFGGALDSIDLGPSHTWTNDGDNSNDAFAVEIDGSDYIFDLPGGLDSRIQVAAKRGSTRKTTTLTVEPSSLKLSQSSVVANDSIIIEGRGFDSQAMISISDITIDGEPLAVEEAGTENGMVQIDSNGQFVIEARVWTATGGSNPAMDADEYTIKVVDSQGFEGEATITVEEPTVSVDPEVAGPRDYITVTGSNWPLSTEEDDFEVDITVGDKTRSANIDGTGKFSYELRLSADIALGEEHDVTVLFEDGGEDIEEDASFMTPSSSMTVSPAEARPGETITVDVAGMPVFTLVEQVRIAGANRLGNQNVNTDRDGDASVSGILVPSVDPGFYSVQVTVGTETAVAQLEILSDAAAPGTATTLPEAASDIGDNLDAIFHFNNATKAWTFFDPRPEFAELNTLTELISGQPYWVLVKSEQVGVDWNGRSVDFTCAGGDCWNLEIW